MNDTTASAPGASLIPDWTGAFTTTHLVLIAVLALLVIAGMIFGARLAHRRRVARAELERHNAEVHRQNQAPPPPLAPPPAPLLREAAPPPVSPVPTTPPAPAAPHAPHVTITPTPAASAAAAATAADGPVTQLKGLGPKLAARLGELGITTVGQLAALTDDDAAALDAQLGPFSGRMGRDRWQEQARFLAAGDTKGFEAVFGRL